jgi:hypothetical protein
MVLKVRKSVYWLSRLGIGLLLVTAMFPSAAWACAVCWGADDPLGRGLNVSILFLMSMPFLIGGSIIGVLFVAQKRAQGWRWLDFAPKGLAWYRRRMNCE